MKRKQILTALLLAAALLLSAGCGAKPAGTTPVETAPAPSASGLAVIHEEEFGGVYLDMTIDAFNALGFAFGDSVDIVFSNGYELRDIPYYNGYYARSNEALLVGYPGYPYIDACIQNGGDLWLQAGLRETDTAEVACSARGAYRAIQDARDIHYVDDRAQFASDEVFANFRSIAAGSLRENWVYRSESPCDDQHKRAAYVDRLIADAGVAYIVDLSDHEGKIQGYLSDPAFACPYFRSLYEVGKVCPLALNMNFGSDEFRGKIAAGLTAMTENPGPYLIHCTEGKDRTGFVCMLLEALCGATYQEIVDDYMVSYDNYYHITRESDPARYEVIVSNMLDPMVLSMTGDGVDPAQADLAAYAEQFLLDAGMDGETVAALRRNLTGAP